MTETSHKDWFVLEGVISEFRWAPGHENLLSESLQVGAEGNGLAAGAAAVLEMYGTAASAAAVATYDGEYTEHCSFNIDDRIVHSTFCGARKLRNGDIVKLVVSEVNPGNFFSHAVQRESDGLLWLPSLVSCGAAVALKDSIRSVLRSAIFGWALISLILVTTTMLGDDSVSWGQTFFLVVVLGFLALGISFGTTFLPGRPNKIAGATGSKIFKLLSFPDADEICMEYARLTFQNDEANVDDVYMYKLALQAMQAKVEITTKFDKV